MRLVCISDTHGFLPISVPDGDVLIHAGDLTRKGEDPSVVRLNDWLGSLPHKHKIVIAGNHDFNFQRSATTRRMLTHAIYLQDEQIELESVTFYGSPWQPWYHDWAFNVKRGSEIKLKWDLIPERTDVLITHGPAYGILDQLLNGTSVGCEELRKRVEKIKPKVHVFGHIHEARGLVEKDETIFVNASLLDKEYQLTHEAIVIDL